MIRLVVDGQTGTVPFPYIYLDPSPRLGLIAVGNRHAWSAPSSLVSSPTRVSLKLHDCFSAVLVNGSLSCWGDNRSFRVDIDVIV